MASLLELYGRNNINAYSDEASSALGNLAGNEMSEENDVMNAGLKYRQIGSALFGDENKNDVDRLIDESLIERSGSTIQGNQREGSGLVELVASAPLYLGGAGAVGLGASAIAKRAAATQINKTARNLVAKRTTGFGATPLSTKPLDVTTLATKEAIKAGSKRDAAGRILGEKLIDGKSIAPGVGAAITGDTIGNVAASTMDMRTTKQDAEGFKYLDAGGEDIMHAIVANIGMDTPTAAIAGGFKQWKKSKTKAKRIAEIYDKGANDATFNVDTEAIRALNENLGQNNLPINDNGFIVVDGDISNYASKEGAYFNPKTGEFSFNSEYAGKVVGNIRQDYGADQGYLQVDLDKSDFNEQLVMDDYKGATIIGVKDKPKVDYTDNNQVTLERPYTSGTSVVFKDDTFQGSDELHSRYKNEDGYDEAAFNKEVDDIIRGNNRSTNMITQEDATMLNLENGVDLTDLNKMKFTNRSTTLAGQAVLNNQTLKSNPAADIIVTNHGKDSAGSKLVQDNTFRNFKARDADGNIIDTVNYNGDRIRQSALDHVFGTPDQKVDDRGDLDSTAKLGTVKASVLDSVFKGVTTTLAFSSKSDLTKIDAKTRRSLAKAAANQAMKFENITPEKGYNSTTLDGINEVYTQLAEQYLNRPEILSKNPDGTYTIADNSIVFKMRNEAVALADSSNISVSTLLTRMNAEFSMDTKDKPIFNSTKTAKVKVKTYMPNKDTSVIYKLAESMADIRFYMDARGTRVLDGFKNLSYEQQLQYLNKGDTKMTPQKRRELESEALALDALLETIDSWRLRMPENGDFMKFPTEVMETVRVRYSNLYSPQSHKIVREILKPEVAIKDKMDLTDDTQVEYAKRLTLGLAGYKPENIDTSSNMNALDTAWSDWMDTYNDKKSSMKDQIMYAASEEGAHSMTAFQNTEQIIRKKVDAEIFGEIDGVVNNAMWLELVAGNFKNEAYGIDPSKSTISTDSIRQEMHTEMKAFFDTQDGAKNTFSHYFDNMKDKDTKYGIMAKLYGSGTYASAGAFGTDMYNEMHKSMAGSEAKIDAVDVIDMINQSVANQNKYTDAMKKQQELITQRKVDFDDALERKSDSEAKIAENRLKAARDKMTTMQAEAGFSVDDIQNFTLANAVSKLNKQNDIIAKAKHGIDDLDSKLYDTVMLDAAEIEAVKQYFTKDAMEAVEATIDRIFDLPENRGMTEGTPEYTAQMNRHKSHMANKKTNTILFDGYARLMTMENMFDSNTIVDQIAEVSNIISNSSDGAIGAPLIARELTNALGKKKGYSVLDIMNAILVTDHGLSLKSVNDSWKFMNEITPYVYNMSGDRVKLATTEAATGLSITDTGLKINVKNLAFRTNNDPLLVFGLDSETIAHGVNDSNIMSVFDAGYGNALENIRAMQRANEKAAEIGLNYNKYNEQRNAVGRMLTLLGDKHNVGEDYAHFAARMKNLDQSKDHLVLKDQEQANNTWSRAYANKMMDDLETLSSDLFSAQKAQGSLTVNNYSIGMVDTEGSSTNSGIAPKVDKFTETTKHQMDVTLYDDIHLQNDILIDRIDFVGLSNLYDSGSVNYNLELGAATDGFNSGIISVKGKSFSPDNFAVVMHEISHGAYDLLTDNSKQALNQFFIDFIDTTNPNRVGTLKGKKVNARSGVESGSFLEVDDKGVPIMEESVVDLIGMLMYNEALTKNATIFASKFNKKNLGSDLIGQQYIEIDSTIVGKSRLYTMADLQRYMKDAYDSTTLDEMFNEITEKVSVSLNSSVDIKSWMNGYNFDKFDSTLNNARKIQKNYDLLAKQDLYKYVSEGFKTNSITGLFNVDAKAEAMAKMSALTKGTDEVYMKNLTNLRDGLMNDIQKRSGGKDSVTISKNIGNLASTGLYKLVDILKGSSDATDFIRQLEQKDIRNTKLEVIDDWLDELLVTTGTKDMRFDKDRKNAMKKFIASEVRALSNGSFHYKTGNSMELASKILKKLDTELHIVDNKDKLARSDMLVNNLSNNLDRLIATDRILHNSNMMDQGHFKKIVKDTFFSGDNLKQVGLDYFELHSKYEKDMKHNGTYQNQFNINPLLKYRTNNFVLSFNGNGGNRAGMITVGRTQVPIYFVPSEEITVGKQPGVLGAFNPSEFFTGRAKLTLGKLMKDDSGSYVILNGEKIIIDPKAKNFKEGATQDAYIKPDTFMRSKLNGEMNEAADFSIHTQIARNQAIVELRRIKHEVQQRAIAIGLDSGVLITEQQYNSTDTNKDTYFEIDKAALDTGEIVQGSSDNAAVRSDYGKLYFEKRFLADIEGTGGARLDKSIDRVFGPGAGKFIKQGTMLAMGARDFIKTTLLLYSPGGWINSFFSSMSIYMANATPGSMIEDARTVDKMTKDYDTAAKKYARTLSNSKSSPEDIAKARKDLEATDMYVAMSHGMSLTIRSDAFANSTYKDNPISTLISELSGNKAAGETFKKFQLDPSTGIGAKVGEYYDKLEVRPKLMLYVNKTRQFKGNKQKGAQAAVMANPQYGRNLPGFASFVDQISPYTKYFVSWPTMAIYAGKTSPGKLAGTYAAYQFALWASWNAASDELTPEEAELYKEGYFKIPGIDAAKYTQSAFNYNLPSKSITEFSIIDASFFPNTVDARHLFTPFLNYNSGWRSLTSQEEDTKVSS